jgi:hypothetical protein
MNRSHASGIVAQFVATKKHNPLVDEAVAVLSVPDVTAPTLALAIPDEHRAALVGWLLEQRVGWPEERRDAVDWLTAQIVTPADRAAARERSAEMMRRYTQQAERPAPVVEDAPPADDVPVDPSSPDDVPAAS